MVQADSGNNAVEGRSLTILHFNDVYNIEDSNEEPVSGAARLAGLIKAEPGNPLVLFSGDAFSPSVMSTVTLGAHMPPVLNTFGIHAACVGNHDFDLGLATCRSLVQKCHFPWLCSNVRDKETGQLLGGLHETLLLEHQGIKIGLMGLVESEWLDTLAALDPEQLEYCDFIKKGTELAEKLRNEGAELVIALTHMREPNDRALASQVPGIDMVLGGHDHHYVVEPVAPHSTLLAKSGTDFRELTRIHVTLPSNTSGEAQRPRPDVRFDHMPVTLDSPKHTTTAEVVARYAKTIGAKLDCVVGYTVCPLDARFQTIRSMESNMGNLVCDIVRQNMRADIVVINSGTLRSDKVHPAGPLRVRDIIELLPMPDSVVLLEVTGAQVLQVLENGVSQVPRLEGRFPQVSGIQFQYDSTKPAGSRVISGSVAVLQQAKRTASSLQQQDSGSTPALWAALQPEATYRVAVKSYMAEGKDGYDVLEKCKVLVSDEDGVVISQALRNHFRSLCVLSMLDPKVKAVAAAKKWVSQAKSKENKESTSQGKGGTAEPPPFSKCEAAASLKPASGRAAGTTQAQPPETTPKDRTQQDSSQNVKSHRISDQDGDGDQADSDDEDTLDPCLSGSADEGAEVAEEQKGAAPSVRRLQSMPTRVRLVVGDTGLCVVSLEHHSYAINSVVEGRMVDVAKGSNKSN